MSVQAPGSRPGQWPTLGDLLDRVRKLEAVRAAATGAGWRFNVINQEPGGGYGIVVFDAQVDYAPASDPSPRSEWSGILDDEFGSGLLLISQDVVNDQQAMVWATPDVANLTVRTTAFAPTIGVARDLGGGVAGGYVYLIAGQVFRVENAGGGTIFEVTEAGLTSCTLDGGGP